MADDYVTRILNIALSLYCDLHVDTRNRDSHFMCTDEWLSRQKKDTDTSEEKMALAFRCSCQTTWHLISTKLCFTWRIKATRLSFLKCWTKVIWKSAAVAECIFLVWQTAHTARPRVPLNIEVRAPVATCRQVASLHPHPRTQVADHRQMG